MDEVPKKGNIYLLIIILKAILNNLEYVYMSPHLYYKKALAEIFKIT